MCLRWISHHFSHFSFFNRHFWLLPWPAHLGNIKNDTAWKINNSYMFSRIISITGRSAMWKSFEAGCGSLCFSVGEKNKSRTQFATDTEREQSQTSFRCLFFRSWLKVCHNVMATFCNSNTVVWRWKVASGSKEFSCAQEVVQILQIMAECDGMTKHRKPQALQ